MDLKGPLRTFEYFQTSDSCTKFSSVRQIPVRLFQKGEQPCTIEDGYCGQLTMLALTPPLLISELTVKP
jgi:hypothetical protein